MNAFVVSLIIVGALSAATPVSSLVECASCRATIEALREYEKDPNHWEKILDIAQGMCVDKAKQTPEVCAGLIQEYSPVIIDSLLNKILDPEYMCVQLQYCTTPKYIPENFTNFVSTVMSGKPPSPGPVPTRKGTLRFAHFSDVHLDFYYTPGTNDECDEPLCCRPNNGAGKAGPWGGLKCDLPVKTFEAALQQLVELKPDFIIITGDFPPHDEWNQSRAYNLEYQTVVSQAFLKYFPSIPIYPMFGNHACFPMNQYKFSDPWIPEPFCEDWKLDEIHRFNLELHGGYTIKHGLSNLRLIAIDTQAGNAGNFFLISNSTDPVGLVNWLYQQLLAAEKNKEVVFLYGHIPFGDVNCLSIWSRHMNVLVDRFEYTIAGLFFGHTHTDEFHITRGIYSNLPVKVQWVVPSLTTYTDHNPSFRMYEIDSETKQILDFTSYRMNISQANLNPNTPPVWDAAYSFKEFYGVKDLTAQSVYNLALNIGNSQALALQYLYNFYGGNSVPTSCDTKCLHDLQCKITYGVFDDIFNCQGNDKDWPYKLNELLFGNWTYKSK